MSAFMPVFGATVTIQQFFNGLVGDLDGFILTASIFALAWAGFLFAFSVDNENRGRAAKIWLYAAMIGLAVAVLAPVIAGLINTAAGGAGK